MKSTRLQSLLVSAFLAIAVVAVYMPLTGFDFINVDDAEYVRENTHINGGVSWAAIKWSFENSVTGNWHPLTMLSHMLDCQLYELSAGGHHSTNLLFHLVDTLLLFWLLLAMTRRVSVERTGTSSNFWPCAFVAALFALHPLHVESVSWISERKDVLSAFFFILTVWAYFNYATKANKESNNVLLKHISPLTWYILSIFLFALGLMCKPMLVTVPFVLFLLDYWPLGRLAGSKPETSVQAIETTRPSFFFLSVEKIPFLIVTVIFCYATMLTQKNAGAVVALANFPLNIRLESVVISYAHYLAKTIWPDALIMLYPWQKWTILQIVCSAVLFLGLSALAFLAARRRPYVFVGWCIFAGMLVPVIGFVQVGQTMMADHHTYLPLIGLFIILAWGLAEFATSPMRRTITATVAILAVIAATAMAAVQVRYWKNSETLFNHSLSVADNNSTAHYILGALLDSQGKEDQAFPHFAAAVRYNPINVRARCALGHIFCDQGKFNDAVQEYQAALQIDPASAKANFGFAEVLMKQHQFDNATEHYFLALKSNPKIAEAHYQLAALFSAKQDMLSAISHLQQAIELDPNFVLALNNLGWILATQQTPALRNGSEAMRLASRAVVLTGRSDPSTLDTLAAAYAETGEFKNAVDTAQLAIQNASAAGHTSLANEIGTRLKLYQSQQAYRE